MRDICIGFYVVKQSGLPEQSFYGRERRTRTRFAAVAFYTCHKSRFFTANECACAQTNVDIELEAGAQNVIAQQAVLARLSDCNLQTVNGNGIFGTNVNITLMCAYRVCGNSHRFQNGVRIAFQNRAVHKRARISFVGVTSNVLNVAGSILGKLPFSSGGEACTATTAKTGLADNVDNFLRSHFRKYLNERLISVVSNVFVDVFRIDYAAVAQSDTRLAFVKIGFGKRHNGFGFFFLFVEKAFHYTTFAKVFGNNFLNVLGFNFCVERAFRINDYYRTYGAKTKTSRLHHLNVFFQSLCFDLCVEFFYYVRRMIGMAARSAAY